MKRIQSILICLLFLLSVGCLWLAFNLKKQRLSIVAHQNQLASLIDDLATHAEIDLPALQPGFEPEAVREMVVYYKNLEGEKAFGEAEVERLNAEMKSTLSRQHEMTQQLKDALADLSEQSEAVAKRSQALSKKDIELRAALKKVKNLEDALVEEKARRPAPVAATRPPGHTTAPSTTTASTSPPPATLPVDGKGKSARILTVNRDWSFVVINAGIHQGVQLNQQIRIRGLGGKTVVAKVSKVEPSIAVADVAEGKTELLTKGDVVDLF